MDQQEKREKRMVNQAYFACVAVILAGCAVLALLAALLFGYRFSADSAAGKKWNGCDTLQKGSFTIYYELSEGETPYITRFAAVEKAGPLYIRRGITGRLVYPVGSDVPAGQVYSYEDGKRWHHILILDMVLPNGVDRTIDRLEVRGQVIDVTYNSCFSTPRRFVEFIIDGVTFELRAN